MNQPRLELPAQGLDSDNNKARDILEAANKKLGFIPNMYKQMVNAPHMLESYLYGYDKFRTESGFTTAEQEVVLLTISRENHCHYCVAAHSFMADKMSGVPSEVTDAIRDGSEIRNDKLRALSNFTRSFVNKRGWVERSEIDDFLAAGYSEAHVLNILLAVSVKTISNYSNHLFATPVDDMFKSREWRG